MPDLINLQASAALAALRGGDCTRCGRLLSSARSRCCGVTHCPFCYQGQAHASVAEVRCAHFLGAETIRCSRTVLPFFEHLALPSALGWRCLTAGGHRDTAKGAFGRAFDFLVFSRGERLTGRRSIVGMHFDLAIYLGAVAVAFPRRMWSSGRTYWCLDPAATLAGAEAIAAALREGLEALSIGTRHQGDSR